MNNRYYIIDNQVKLCSYLSIITNNIDTFDESDINKLTYLSIDKATYIGNCSVKRVL